MRLTRWAAALAASALVGIGAAGGPGGASRPAAGGGDVDAASAARFADLALACVHQEYPNKIAHVLSGDADVKPPRELTPAFYGCYDWHSSVHGHWLLARLARTFPDAPFAASRPGGARREPDAGAHRGRGAYLQGPGARASSGRTAWRGCCSSPPNCASGTTRRRGSGPRRCRRSKRRPRRGSRTGCRSSRGRSGSASTIRPRSPSASSSTGRGRPATGR